MQQRFSQSVLALFLILLSPVAFATAQEPDKILIDQSGEWLDTNPLRAFLQKHPDLLPESDIQSTSNWRGYVATWEVTGDALFLIRVDVDFSDAGAAGGRNAKITRNVMDKLFPGAERVLANWYSGALVIPRGKVIKYVHMGYGSTHERYSIILVKSGHITRRLDLNAEAFEAYRASQFQKFKATAEYRKLLEATMSKDAYYTAERAQNFLYEFASEDYLSAEFGQDP